MTANFVVVPVSLGMIKGAVVTDGVSLWAAHQIAHYPVSDKPNADNLINSRLFIV
ncbi:hypothetical protein [Vibrio parahaemolyticus]|uniref:hypothetical protein n=1 Tax=Vibrio parahaemolyticus TaxID=670 RepID=UPI0013E31C83|nr:hypothetical protein [Vibrio parahaemolyticus]